MHLLAFDKETLMIGAFASMIVAGVVVFGDTSAAGVCLPMAALILSAFLVPLGSGTRENLGFQRQSYGYIIVDAPSLSVCSGYFGWLISKRKT